MNIKEKVLKKVNKETHKFVLEYIKENMDEQIFLEGNIRKLQEKAISLTLAEVEKIIDGRIRRCKEMGTPGHLIVINNLEILKQKLKNQEEK